MSSACLFAGTPATPMVKTEPLQRAKGMVNNGLPLPAPLTDEVLAVAMKELPDGTRRATETCLKCYKDKKFTASDFISFIKSLQAQSATLNQLFRDVEVQNIKKVAHKSAVTTPTSHLHPSFRCDWKQAPRTMQDLVEHDDTKFEKTEAAVDMTAKLIERRRREVKRRQFAGYPGASKEKRNRYLYNVIRRLAKQVPLMGQRVLRDAIRDYSSRVATPEQFVAVMQKIVDEYGITVPLQYTPEHETRHANAHAGYGQNKRGSSALGASEGNRKRARPAPVINVDSALSTPTSAHTPPNENDWEARSQEMSSVGSSSHLENTDHLCVYEQQMQFQCLSIPDGPVSSAELQDTKLGRFLTARAQAESLPERNVVVKVVSQVNAHTGSGDVTHPYVIKSIFAFQQVDLMGEVMLLGMYVHEFGQDASPETAGRVFLECVDSIPIHGNERSEERQRLLTAIVHGYIEYVKLAGFRHVHLRVPAPSAENHHIFTARSLSVRLEATVRMVHWYRRLLEGAQQKGLLHSFQLSSHLSRIENFPPAILPSSDLAEEHAFSTMRSQLSRSLQSGERKSEADVRLFQKLVAFKDRFCVADLQDPAVAMPVFQGDDCPLLPTPVAAKRLTFVLACKRESLSFGTLADAKMSTMLLLARMISDQRGHRISSQMLEAAAPQPNVFKAAESSGCLDDLSCSAPAWSSDIQGEEGMSELRWGDIENNNGDADALEDCGLDAEIFADSFLSM